MAINLVKSDRTAGRAPPRELGQHGKQLWDNISAEWVIEDSAGVAMLALRVGVPWTEPKAFASRLPLRVNCCGLSPGYATTRY